MPRKNIVCFGDSNTHGFDIETGWRFEKEERFTGILEKMLGEEYTLYEEGLNGRTTVFDDVLYESLAGIDAISMVLQTHEPLDLLILMLGTNDTKARFCASPQDISRGLERVIEKAKASKAWRREARILVLAPAIIGEHYKKGPFAKAMGEGCDEKSKELPRLFRDMARRNRVDFLDINQIEGISTHRIDGLHLTKESHKALAEALTKWVKEQL